MHTLKNLAVAAAMVGLVASAQAEYYPGSTDFEGESPLTDACWSNVVEAADVADASVGGGWQVGRRDDDWSDFGHEGAVSNEYHVVDGNMRHVPRAIPYTGDGNHTKSRECWHAVMPRSLAGEYDWILHRNAADFSCISRFIPRDDGQCWSATDAINAALD